MHFCSQVNGIDQGPAASNVPEKVYGVVGECFRFEKYQLNTGNFSGIDLMIEMIVIDIY